MVFATVETADVEAVTDNAAVDDLVALDVAAAAAAAVTVTVEAFAAAAVTVTVVVAAVVVALPQALKASMLPTVPPRANSIRRRDSVAALPDDAPCCDSPMKTYPFIPH